MDPTLTTPLLHYLTFVPRRLDDVKSKYNLYGLIWTFQLWSYKAIPDLADLCVRLINERDGVTHECHSHCRLMTSNSQIIGSVNGDNATAVLFPTLVPVQPRPVDEDGVPRPLRPQTQKMKAKKKRAHEAAGESSGNHGDERVSRFEYERMLRDVDERWDRREQDLLKKVDGRWDKREDKIFTKVKDAFKKKFRRAKGSGTLSTSNHSRDNDHNHLK